MPSPLEGLFDPPPAVGNAKPAEGGNTSSPLSAALGAVQRHGGLLGVLQQLDKAGAGELAQTLLAGGLGRLDARPGAQAVEVEKPKP